MGKRGKTLIGCLLLIFAVSAQADIIRVPGDRATIQAGIDAARNGDTVLVSDGTYRGAGNMELDLKGKEIAVESRNGAGATIIDCEKAGRGFYFHSGEASRAIVRGFTIKNGRAPDGYGGAISCRDSSSPTIEDNIITGNSAEIDGGGIYCYSKSSPVIRNNEIRGNTTVGSGGGIHCFVDSNPAIQGNTISGNRADRYGGGIYCYTNCRPDIRGNTINGNEANTFGGGLSCEEGSSPTIRDNIINGNKTGRDGGGIYCFSNSSPTIQDNVITENKAENTGGGISCHRWASPIVQNNVISENQASRDGGGISCQSRSFATVQNNKIDRNNAGDNGAGIYCDSSSSMAVKNSLITRNQSGTYGGGVYCATSIKIINSTLCDNRANGGFGGGLYCFDGTPVVTNTILWENSPKDIYVVETAGIDITYSAIKGGWAGKGNINKDPMFVNAATGNYHLLSNSPCIGAGTTGEDVPVTDIEGRPRTAPPDMGAYEDKPAPIRGDVNKDGLIRANDAILTLQIVTEKIIPTDYQKWAADMNEDGTIRSNDAILILRKAAGLAAPGAGIQEFAASHITLTLEESYGLAGERVTIPLKADNADGIAGGDIIITYNPQALRAVGVLSEPGVLIASNTDEPGIVRIAFASIDGLGSDTLAEIQFDMLADNPSSLKAQRVEIYNFDGLPFISRSADHEFRSWAMRPEYSALLQNFPNPFNPETWIPYQLKEGGRVKIRIHSAAGELLRELDLGYRPAGIYTNQERAAYWDGRSASGEEVASGVYFYSIQAGDFSAVRKLTVVR